MPTQTYDPPISSDTLANSRPKWNDSLDALRVDFEGPTAPASPTALMRWADTGNMLLKRRDSTNTNWITIGKLDADYMGLLSLDEPGQVIQVPLDMGGNTLDNLGLGGLLSAARVQELNLKADSANPAFTGQASIDEDPTNADSLARKSWIENTFLPLSGAAMTGRISIPTNPAAGPGHALRKDEIENSSFNTTTGHSHDGTNSKKIEYSDLNNSPEFILPPDRVQIFTQAGNTTGWASVDISAHTGSNTATKAFLLILARGVLAETGSSIFTVSLRKKGEATVDPPAYFFTVKVSGDHHSQSAWVDVDSNQEFEVQIQSGDAWVTTEIYLHGYRT